MKKYVIYSVLTGNYDEIHQPLVVDERFDFILFSDRNIGCIIGVWRVLPIPYDGDNLFLKSRYPKILPTKVLDEYEASLYIDANLSINCTWVYDRFFDLVNAKVEWAGIKHPDRDCVYDEICTIVKLRLMHDYEGFSVYCFLKQSGYPEHNGLLENNVIFRRHTPIVHEVGIQWWHNLENGGKRDQLYLMFVLWKLHVNTELLLKDGESARQNSKYFTYSAHKRHFCELALFERIRRYYIHVFNKDEMEKGYHKLFEFLYKYHYSRGEQSMWKYCIFPIYGLILIGIVKYRLLKLLEICSWIPDKTYVKLYYIIRNKERLHLRNPINFNDKLNWLKIYDRNNLYSLMVDKYAVKEYVGKIIGKQYVVKNYGVWDSFDDIDFSQLPDRFILKCTHDSGGICICRNKMTFDKLTAKEKLDESLRKNYYTPAREWPYKNVRPRIIADELLDDGREGELQDYKLWCFNGEVKIMQITNKGTSVFENFYDINFVPLDIDQGFSRASEYQKPKEFELMKTLAEKLSMNIPFVRVDFFDVKGKVFFGEMTFFVWGGMKKFVSKDWNRILGEWIKLPSK